MNSEEMIAMSESLYKAFSLLCTEHNDTSENTPEINEAMDLIYAAYEALKPKS